MRSVEIPAERVTSVAWGGIEHDALYVTTMRLGLSMQELKKQPAAGAVFKVVNLPAKGRRSNEATSCLLDNTLQL